MVERFGGRTTASLTAGLKYLDVEPSWKDSSLDLPLGFVQGSTTPVVHFLPILLLSFTLLHPAASAVESPSLAEMARMSDEQLQEFDIAYLNLRCAEGLPGSEGLDVDGALKKLEFMAAWVRRETDKNLYRYHREPALFGSEGRFRAGMMVTILKQDFRLQYNPERGGSDPEKLEPGASFFADSKDVFVNGFLRKEDAYGTCASFPVLFATIGRRLGYPIKIVTTRRHLFCRWEDQNERFNIEGTNGGMKVHPDAYYRSWPHQIDEKFIRANGHLVNQTPKHELAGFLVTRADCLLAHGRKREAFEAVRLARTLAPDISYYQRLHDHLAKPPNPDPPSP